MKQSTLNFVILLLFAFLAVITLGKPASAWAESNDEQLTAFLQQNHATPNQQAAYRFALHHGEALKKIPCYCGCVRFGHKSNYNCFFKPQTPGSQKLAIEPHGMVCSMCVNIALSTEHGLKMGMPLSVIRERIDANFKAYPKLHPTVTPLPTDHEKI